MQIWDTAGQERFQSLAPAFYRGADCCVLVYDVTSTASFTALETFRKEFLINASPRDPDNFPFVVVGNKIDLENRTVTTKQARTWCRRKGIPHYETSAKELLCVDQALDKVVREALKHEVEAQRYEYRQLKINAKEGSEKRPNNCGC